MDERLQELRDRLQSLHNQSVAIVNTADDEKRDLTADELARVESLGVEAANAQRVIDARERVNRQREELSQPTGRRPEPTPLPTAHGNPVRVPAEPRDGRCGFRSLGEYARSVMLAARPGGAVLERRLEALAPTAYANEGTGSDGGFAVPPDFRAAIVDKVMGEESLISRTMKMTTSGSSIKFPTNEDEPWGSAGVTAAWVGEGTRITESKPKLGAVAVELNKVAALVPVTDELLRDAPALDAFLRAAVPAAITFKVDEAILFGTGVGQPRGALESGSKVRVSQVGSQTADTVVYGNVASMWSRMYGPCRKNAVWLINQDVEPQLSTLTIATGTASGQLVYMPPGGLSGAGYGTLFGRPVLTSEHANTLGDEGDIILWDPQTYVSLTPAGQGNGMQFDTSIHLWFDYQVNAFRWVFRVGGKSWWSKSVTRAKSSLPLSNLVTVEDRAGGG